MSLFNLFKSAFVKQEDLLKAKDKSFGKTLLYILLLSLVMFIPVGLEIVKALGTVQNDLNEITAKLPEFSIEDNTLQTAEIDSGFIYTTDYLVFTFDPDGKREPRDLQDDLVGNVIGLGLLKDQLILTVTDSNLLTSFIPSTLISLSYNNIDSRILSKEWLAQTINETTGGGRLISISFLIAIFPIFIDFILTLVLISLMANIFNRMRLGTLRFMDTFKIISFSATIPTIIATGMMIFFPTFNSNFFLMAMTFFIYMRVIRPTLPTLTPKE